MPARAIMFQGTASNVGKSLLVAGLARALTLRGLRVLPFKPQNMSNNAAVTKEGGEIGRAQWLQALAARVEPSVHMNPVLLKPQSETGAQIVVQGKVYGQADARAFQDIKRSLLPAVMASFASLKEEADVVLVEGAGSASELNLRANDIANMGFARVADVPVVVIGDIDRGGVIASLAGTKAVLAPEDETLVAGFIVNRMRGDISLFSEGMETITRLTGWPALGLVPFFDKANVLPAEDAYDLAVRRTGRADGKIRIAVPLLPRIANFDDLDPLAAEPDVDLILIRRGRALPVCDLVILPGSKATMADLAALRAEGWDVDIAAHVRRGGYLLGLCGGYQMLGRTIADPDGVEGRPGEIPGLGHLQIETVIDGEKVLAEVSGSTIADGLPVRGYEMHMGVSRRADGAEPFIRFDDGRLDGAVATSGRVAGTYVHGFFSDDRQRRTWIERLGGTASPHNYEHLIEETLDALAAHLEAHADVERLLRIAR